MSEAGAGAQDWRRFSPEELARQYSPRGTVNNLDALLQDYRLQSQPMYDLPHLRDVRYGPQADELLDFFPVPGRTDAPLLAGKEYRVGSYELVFCAGDYLRQTGQVTGETLFLDEIPIRFGISEEAAHYHVPLLISPFAYSTYRGS